MPPTPTRPESGERPTTIRVTGTAEDVADAMLDALGHHLAVAVAEAVLAEAERVDK